MSNPDPTQENDNQPEPLSADPSRKDNKGGGSNAIGCALATIGLLILVPSGLCTVLLLPAAFTEPGGSGVLFSLRLPPWALRSPMRDSKSLPEVKTMLVCAPH